MPKSTRESPPTLTTNELVRSWDLLVTALATKADGWPFCFPHGVAVDSNGNLYMADLTYSAIWKISPDGKKLISGRPTNSDFGERPVDRPAWSEMMTALHSNGVKTILIECLDRLHVPC
jgi:hypothetical protein